MGDRGGGEWWWMVGSQRHVVSSTRRQTAVLCFHKVTEANTIYSTAHDGRWKQFGTTNIFVSATYWLHRPCSAPSWFDRVGKKPFVKADLAIYTYTVEWKCCSVKLANFGKLNLLLHVKMIVHNSEAVVP